MRKEKAAGALSGLSGAASILGSWQVCHSACLGLIALLGVLGIVVTGMPLLFLTRVALPFWIAAVLLLGVTVALSMRMRCVPRKFLLVNGGLIVAGVPFKPLAPYAWIFWIAGSGLAGAGLALFVRERLARRAKGWRQE